MKRCLPWFLTTACAAAPAVAQDQNHALAVAREVERLAAGPALWPGFDLGAIPLAVYDGRQTLLLRHPSPPAGFTPLPGSSPAAFVMQGRHAAVTSNTSADIGGTMTATLLADGPRAAIPASDLAAVAAHEAFHVFQRSRHATWSGNEGDLFRYPATDSALLALRREETELLRLAQAAEDVRTAACQARAALDARRRRFAAMDSVFALYERRSELNEGLATYLQLRALGRTAVAFPERDFAPGEVRLRIYTVGPALAFLLDRVAPGWPQELEANDRQSLDELLSRALATASGDARCGLDAPARAALTRQAGADARAVVRGREARLAALERRPGWRVVVEPAPGAPLWPQGFDPLNVEPVDGGRLLHGRFLRLGNEAGSLTAIDEAGADVEVLTEPAGAHPLFNGVRRAVVAGLPRPTVDTSGARVVLRGAGLTLELRGSASVSDSTITVRMR